MNLIPSRFFLSQIKEFNAEEKKLIGQKLELAKINPFRYKSINVPGMTKVFEIKITLNGLYRRIIYSISGEDIRIECIINRKDDFKDLVKFIFKAENEK